MCNMNWIVQDAVADRIWQRCAAKVPPVAGSVGVGLNQRFRCYRYGPGDYFKPHTDGSWPGSRVVDGKLKADAFGDRWSQLTFLLLLSEGYEGGETVFHVNQARPNGSQYQDTVQVMIIHQEIALHLYMHTHSRVTAHH